MSKTDKKQPEQPKSPEEIELFADINVNMKSGHLVRDAELVKNGQFVKIRIASNQQYLGENNEPKNITDYFNILVSRNLQEAYNIAKDLKKGDWAYFKGKDHSKSFDTPEGYKQTGSTLFAYKATLKRQAGSKEDQPQNAPGIKDDPSAAPA